MATLDRPSGDTPARNKPASSEVVAKGAHAQNLKVPHPKAVLELFKPITWFPPMWAYLCGAVSVGWNFERWPYVLVGVILAGPVICGTSQAINDWFDREVDAINEPDRVIPSGRMPGRWGLYFAIGGSIFGAILAATLGLWVFIAALIGIAMAWAYSAPPLRFKNNGWIGNGAVGFSYESLPWLTAAAAALGTMPPVEVFIIALLYGAGAHGIMTLNDFKAIEGDRLIGIKSLPATLGPRKAAISCAVTMIGAQLGVIACLLIWNAPTHAMLVAGVLIVQAVLLARFIGDPKKRALGVSAFGVLLYVIGMLITATALPTITGLV